VLELGRKLVEVIGPDQHRDVLSTWMAHYIAEKMLAAETASGDDRSAKLKECADAIFAVWEHRHSMPNGMRPFEDFEAILRVLQSLDPDEDIPRYSRVARTAAKEDAPEPESAKWLDVADGLDYTARILIRYCLGRASEGALEKAKEWVALAEVAAAERELDLTVLRIVFDEAELAGAPDLTDIQRQEAEDRIRRLESFKKMAEAVIEDLRSKLA
jgi:hypothetical protein